MSITRVQETKGQSTVGATTLTISYGSAPTAGNCLFMAVGTNVNNNTVSSVTSTGASWSKIANFLDTTRNKTIEIWGAANISSGAASSVTITVASASDMVAIIAEYSGLGTSVTLDQTSHGTGNTTTAATGNTSTTTQANELWLNLILAYNNPSTAFNPPALSAPTNSYTIVDQSMKSFGLSLELNLGWLERIVTSTGTAGGNATVADVTGGGWSAFAVTIYGSSTPPPVVSRRRAAQGFIS